MQNDVLVILNTFESNCHGINLGVHPSDQHAGLEVRHQRSHHISDGALWFKHLVAAPYQGPELISMADWTPSDLEHPMGTRESPLLMDASPLRSQITWRTSAKHNNSQTMVLTQAGMHRKPLICWQPGPNIHILTPYTAAHMTRNVLMKLQQRVTQVLIQPIQANSGNGTGVTFHYYV